MEPAVPLHPRPLPGSILVPPPRHDVASRVHLQSPRPGVRCRPSPRDSASTFVGYPRRDSAPDCVTRTRRVGERRTASSNAGVQPRDDRRAGVSTVVALPPLRRHAASTPPPPGRRGVRRRGPTCPPRAPNAALFRFVRLLTPLRRSFVRETRHRARGGRTFRPFS